jgi:nicotinate-nucleotide adenylyltransferase
LRKIAIYGGTFDPVHHAHLILARDALEALSLDQVIFIPAAISPVKKTAPIASTELRLAMVEAAIASDPKFSVDDCELRRPPPSYTIDTVQEVQRRNADAAMYCLIGEDNVDGLKEWRRFSELEKVVQFIVLDRSGRPATHSYPVINRKVDISATEIRTRVAAGRSIRYFVPPAV